jgi:hypothetical protein
MCRKLRSDGMSFSCFVAAEQGLIRGLVVVFRVIVTFSSHILGLDA